MEHVPHPSMREKTDEDDNARTTLEVILMHRECNFLVVVRRRT